MTAMLEMLVNERTIELLRKLNDWEQKNFFAQVPTYRPGKKKSECGWERISFYSISLCNCMPADDDAPAGSGHCLW